MVDIIRGVEDYARSKLGDVSDTILLGVGKLPEPYASRFTEGFVSQGWRAFVPGFAMSMYAGATPLASLGWTGTLLGIGAGVAGAFMAAAVPAALSRQLLHRVLFAVSESVNRPHVDAICDESDAWLYGGVHGASPAFGAVGPGNKSPWSGGWLETFVRVSRAVAWFLTMAVGWGARQVLGLAAKFRCASSSGLFHLSSPGSWPSPTLRSSRWASRGAARGSPAACGLASSSP